MEVFQFYPTPSFITESALEEFELAIDMYSEFFELYIEDWIDNAPRYISIAKPI